MIAFKTSLELLPAIKTVLEECKDPLLSGLREDLDPLEDIHNLLEDSIIEEPPLCDQRRWDHQGRIQGRYRQIKTC